MSSMGKKYVHLLENADVNRWFENLRARSIITATVYLRTLGLFCKLNNTTPTQILNKAESKAFRDEFIDFVRKFEKWGKAGSYIVRFKKVLHKSRYDYLILLLFISTRLLAINLVSEDH